MILKLGNDVMYRDKNSFEDLQILKDNKGMAVYIQLSTPHYTIREPPTFA